MIEMVIEQRRRSLGAGLDVGRVLPGVTFGAGKMLVLGADASSLCAVEHAAVMVLGGEPVGERFVCWNFVASSKDLLAQAAADWKAGRMTLPDAGDADDADDAEFTPLPEGPAP